MSEETPIQQQESEKPSQSYISRVRLKGYKSILDTEVTFKPGLNIIIGANGSGKTNFVEYIEKIFKWNYIIFRSSFAFEIDFYTHNVFFKLKSNADYILDYASKPLDSGIDINEEWFTSLEKESTKIEYSISLEQEFFQSDFYLKYKKYLLEFTNLKFSFSLPDKIIGLNENFNALIGVMKPVYLSSSESKFVNNIFWHSFLSNDFIEILRKNQIINKDIVLELIKIDDCIKEKLRIYSPIKDLRISPNFNISLELDNFTRINFLSLEFSVHENWLSWNQLSDGTKRLFLIITDILSTDNGFCLLEEPELGIHPHQLIRLMDFIKEQSETKQIIMTTHSPEVLNTLKMDELDRIIVACYDKEKGTQMSHLSEDDIAHARSYMKDELFLSDYWVMSGFETEEEAV